MFFKGCNSDRCTKKGESNYISKDSDYDDVNSDISDKLLSGTPSGKWFDIWEKIFSWEFGKIRGERGTCWQGVRKCGFLKGMGSFGGKS